MFNVEDLYDDVRVEGVDLRCRCGSYPKDVECSKSPKNICNQENVE